MKRWRDARQFKEKDDAVAGIVVAVMIVGLIIAVISVVQTIYVPKWMEQMESEHMDGVADQFAMLKYAIDTQVLIEQSTPISTPITLGNKELPFLVSSKAFGDLAVLDNQFYFKIGFNDGTSGTYESDVIRYVSENAYYLDQSYIYEGGALILSQADGTVMTMKPIFYAEKDELIPDKFNITFTMVAIDGKGDKTTVSGYGTYPIQTQYTSKVEEIDPPFADIDYIEIKTAYPLVWERFINDTLNNSNMDFDDHYTVTVSEYGNSWLINIDIDTNCEVNLFFAKSTVSAQIAPGWVE